MKLDQREFKPVYILGAGSTAMLGAPLLNDFLQRARELRFSEKFPETLKEMFDAAFQYQASLSQTRNFMATDLENLEVLFSLVDMDHQTSAVNGMESKEYKRLSVVRSQFLALVIETLRYSARHSGEKWNQYNNLMRCLGAADGTTFITFNYDLSIETAIESTGRYVAKFGFSKGETPTLSNKERFVLKLHGSADWAFCQSCNAIHAFRKYVNPNEYISRRHEIHDISKCTETEKFSSVLIPPTWQKSNYTEAITRVWHYGIEEISLATHLFIIGYSFPRTDLFFDQLLSMGLRQSQNLRKVVIVNPAYEVDKQIRDLFDIHFYRKRVLFIPRKFEDLLGVLTMEIDSTRDMEMILKRLEEEYGSRSPRAN